MSNLTIYFYLFFFLKGKENHGKSSVTSFKELTSSKSFASRDWELLELHLAGLQSLQNTPVPSSRVYHLHGFLPR